MMELVRSVSKADFESSILGPGSPEMDIFQQLLKYLLTPRQYFNRH